MFFENSIWNNNNYVNKNSFMKKSIEQNTMLMIPLPNIYLEYPFHNCDASLCQTEN